MLSLIEVRMEEGKVKNTSETRIHLSSSVQSEAITIVNKMARSRYRNKMSLLRTVHAINITPRRKKKGAK